MSRQLVLLAASLLCVGCSSVAPPPDLVLERANVQSVPQMIAAATVAANATADNKPRAAITEFNNIAASEAARVAALPRPARRLRERQMLEVLAVVAETPEARAAAQIALKEKDKEEEKNEERLEDLLGGGLGIGLTITYNLNDDRVASAVLAGETGKEVVRVTKDENIAARLLLEGHYLFTTNPFNQTMKSDGQTFNAAASQRENCRQDAASCPSVAIGPFIGIQQTDDGTSFDALAVGLAFGFRPTEKAGLTIGVGAMFDTSVQVLGEGVTAGKPLPPGETTIRFKETGQVNPLISISLTF
jgi:hypothetical protein